MAYRNLDEFLARLEQDGEVTILPVGSPVKAANSAGKDAPKVIVHKDQATETRCISGLFATQQRVEKALRVTSLKLLADRLEAMLDVGKPGSFGAMVGQAMQLFSALRTNTNRRAPNSYERLTASEWGGRTAALGDAMKQQRFCATLMTGGSAATMRPVNVLIADHGLTVTSAPRFVAGEEIVLVVGGDPAFMFAAWTPIPDLIHRSFLASWLRERPLEVMRLPSLEFDVPSNAEAVIIATVQSAKEGEANQFLDPDRFQLELNIDSVFVRPNAIYPQLADGERAVIADALFDIFQPALRRLLPELNDSQIRPFILTVAGEYMTARTNAAGEIDTVKEQ